MNRKQLLKIAAMYVLWKRTQRRPRSAWVHEILQVRYQLGTYHRLVQELRLDEERFVQYFRLNRGQFDELLRRVGPRITKQDTRCRLALPPAERLAICLRYLATGNSFHTIGFYYRVGHNTVSGIVAEVTRAIFDVLVADYMAVPTTEDWKAIEKKFCDRWDFPNCVGSIDGKHVRMRSPSNSGSMYYNYKGTYSIVLLAVVDAEYCFRIIDVGSYGRSSDGGTLSNSTFGQALQDGTLGLPPAKPLPGADHLGAQPHVFVGDEAFPLRRNLMRPFPGVNLPNKQRVFNYRMSRARMIVENTFGILAAQWRMYHSVIQLEPANVEACVKATCILHNFMRRTSSPNVQNMHGDADACVLQGINRAGSNHSAQEAIRVRETFATYFSAEGAI